MSIGVLLGGCGHLDGSDVHETVFVLCAIESAGERAILLAPDVPQERTIDHLSGESHEGTRGVLQESARLSRRPVRSLVETRPEELEALIIPGGYGPVVNFSTSFARLGEPHALRAEVVSFLSAVLQAGKPIGCSSLGEIPILRMLGESIDVPATPGSPGSLTIDETRGIVRTPGFTVFTRLADVRAGIEAMVAEVLARVGRRRRMSAAAAGAAGPPESRSPEKES